MMCIHRSTLASIVFSSIQMCIPILLTEHFLSSMSSPQERLKLDFSIYRQTRQCVFPLIASCLVNDGLHIGTKSPPTPPHDHGHTTARDRCCEYLESSRSPPKWVIYFAVSTSVQNNRGMQLHGYITLGNTQNGCDLVKRGWGTATKLQNKDFALNGGRTSIVPIPSLAITI